ncbi:MAG: ATP-binding protein, partial [Candidatus Methanofastidiosia archaeon]
MSFEFTLKPVKPENFVGRNKELEIFEKLKESEKESLFIYGVAGIGKTSLIEKYMDIIDEKNLIVYVRTTENALHVVKEIFEQPKALEDIVKILRKE